MTSKTCTKCGIEKPIEEFPKSKYASQQPDSISGGRNSWCHACILVQKRDYYRRNYSKIQARCMEWRNRNKKKYLTYLHDRYVANPERARNDTLKRLYGITIAQFKDIARAQNNVCAVCRSDKPLHVDHCHETGAIRGLLCTNCNKAIGLLSDSPSIAQRLTDYLELTFAGPPDYIIDALAKNGWRRPEVKA